jgi:hypothetical protein
MYPDVLTIASTLKVVPGDDTQVTLEQIMVSHAQEDVVARATTGLTFNDVPEMRPGKVVTGMEQLKVTPALVSLIEALNEAAKESNNVL